MHLMHITSILENDFLKEAVENGPQKKVNTSLVLGMKR